MKAFHAFVIIGLAASVWATRAGAWTVDNGGANTPNGPANLSDPDEKAPFKPDGKGGGTYNFGGSKFSIHMSGPQGDSSSQRDETFTPAGQRAIGPQYFTKPRSRSLFPMQP